MHFRLQGNVVDLWERLASEPELLVDLGSDQTSLHNPYGGGYYPVSLTMEEADKMMVEDLPRFVEHVHDSLRRQTEAINKLTSLGMKFWDYGNSFLLQASRAHANIMKPNSLEFRYPSYVEDVMGDIFSLGFGPFRCELIELISFRVKLPCKLRPSCPIRDLFIMLPPGSSNDRSNCRRGH
jgi:urocanate hydratase